MVNNSKISFMILMILKEGIKVLYAHLKNLSKREASLLQLLHSVLHNDGS